MNRAIPLLFALAFGPIPAFASYQSATVTAERVTIEVRVPSTRQCVIALSPFFPAGFESLAKDDMDEIHEMVRDGILHEVSVKEPLAHVDLSIYEEQARALSAVLGAFGDSLTAHIAVTYSAGPADKYSMEQMGDVTAVLSNGRRIEIPNVGIHSALEDSLLADFTFPRATESPQALLTEIASTLEVMEETSARLRHRIYTVGVASESTERGLFMLLSRLERALDELNDLYTLQIPGLIARGEPIDLSYYAQEVLTRYAWERRRGDFSLPKNLRLVRFDIMGQILDEDQPKP